MHTVTVKGLTPDGFALVYDVEGIELVAAAPDPELPRIDLVGYLDDGDQPIAWATTGHPATEPVAPVSIPAHGVVALVHVPAGKVPQETDVSQETA